MEAETRSLQHCQRESWPLLISTPNLLKLGAPSTSHSCDVSMLNSAWSDLWRMGILFEFRTESRAGNKGGGVPGPDPPNKEPI